MFSFYRLSVIAAYTSVIVCLIWCVQIISQESGITVTSSVDQNEITIGDLIAYTVTINHRSDYEITSPGLAANLGQFEIRDYEVPDIDTEGDRVTAQFLYKITTFDTGSYVIPPLAIGYMTPDSVQQIITTESINIYVRSVLSGEAPELIDIKAPLEIPRDWSRHIFWGSIGLAVLVILGSAWYLYRRYKAGKSLLPLREEKVRPAHEVALEALDRLTDSTLIDDRRYKDFYIELSEIIRRYIEGRYRIIAVEMTTTQLMQSITERALPQDIQELIHTFLNECDLVKFAKYIPAADEHTENVTMAYDIINRTKLPVIEDTEEQTNNFEHPESHAVDEPEGTSQLHSQQERS